MYIPSSCSRVFSHDFHVPLRLSFPFCTVRILLLGSSDSVSPLHSLGLLWVLLLFLLLLARLVMGCLTPDNKAMLYCEGL